MEKPDTSLAAKGLLLEQNKNWSSLLILITVAYWIKAMANCTVLYVHCTHCNTYYAWGLILLHPWSLFGGGPRNFLFFFLFFLFLSLLTAKLCWDWPLSIGSMDHRAIVPICLKLYTLIKLRLSGGVLHLLHLRGGLHGGDDTQHPPLRTGHGTIQPPTIHIENIKLLLVTI